MNLADFLKQWDESNSRFHKQIELFDPDKTKQLIRQQQRYFAEVFYHVRAHFGDFLWVLGTRAPDKRSKQLILENYAEEFGGDGPSHERLYLDFAQELGADVTRADSYLPFMQDYNATHVNFLRTHDWETCMIAFSAYERLDNLDYKDLERVIKSFGLSGKALTFFQVHKHVQHFQMVSRDLQAYWDKDSKKVEYGFTFIGDHQNWMWKNLSDTVFAFQG